MTITFLFTDIEGSTRLWEQHPEAMSQALARHNEILRAAMEAQGGHVFETMGDAFCSAFGSAPAALEAALAAQRALQAEAWPGEIHTIQVRMALHTGTAEPREDDYVGPPLNRVARLEAAAHGGQVLLSLATQELVRDSLPQTTSLRDLGSHRLKDLFRPEHVYQLVAPGLPDEFAPAAHARRAPDQPAGPAHALHRAGTRARCGAQPAAAGRRAPGHADRAGRDRQDAARAAGGGEPARRVRRRRLFRRPVPAARPGVGGPDDRRDAGVRPAEGAPAVQTLAEHLAEKHVLLLLDNFEQVVTAASDVGPLLSGAPHLKVLASSRHLLNIYGEHEYPVPPLGLPERRRRQTAAVLSQYESVALFIQRAKAVKADFQITGENAPAIAEICVRLDGLPLAIELAAARSKMLHPTAMLERLAYRLGTLRGGAQNVPVRQRTMRGAIDWSYDLLDKDERTLFARLGVFRHGWFLGAAETVCGGLDLDVFAGLESLLDKSLVREMPSGTGETRFALLEVLREYAAEKLAASGEAEAVGERHADYYAGLAEQLGAWDQEHGGDIFYEEMDNFRAAIDRLIEVGAPARPLQIIRSLWGALGASGFADETLGWLDRILAQGEKLEPGAYSDSTPVTRRTHSSTAKFSRPSRPSATCYAPR